MSEIVSAWKERFRPRALVLSNGESVVVRPVIVEALAANGTIPLTLFGGGEEGKKPKKKATLLDPDTLQMVHAVVMAAAVEPRVTGMGTEEGEDSIPLDYIPLGDRYRIFEEVTEAATAPLAPFRAEPSGDAGDARGGEDVREAAERVAGAELG